MGDVAHMGDVGMGDTFAGDRDEAGIADHMGIAQNAFAADDKAGADPALDPSRIPGRSIIRFLHGDFDPDDAGGEIGGMITRKIRGRSFSKQFRCARQEKKKTQDGDKAPV